MGKKTPEHSTQSDKKNSSEVPQRQPADDQGVSAPWLALALVIIATFGVYVQVASHEFIHFDTAQYVFENERVKGGLSLEGVRWAFTTTEVSNWHPLTWLSYMLDAQLFGIDSRAFHLTNLFIHLLNTGLLYFVFRRMTGATWPSAAVAALFALHPLHVESVAWVAERKDVLSTLFGLLAIGLYVGYVETSKLDRYVLALLAFSLSLMAKPMLVTLPFVLLLLDFWPLDRLRSMQLRPKRKRERKAPFPDSSSLKSVIWEKAPFLVLSGVSSVVTLFAQGKGGAIQSQELFPIGARVSNALDAYVAYIGKTIWPSKLGVFYPHWYDDFRPESLWSALLLASISVLVIRAGAKRRYLAVGWLWFIGTMVPVIGLVQVGEQAMADRYTYVPLIGLFVIVAWGVPDLARRWRVPKRILVTLVAVVLLLFSGQTWLQIGRWKTAETLARHTLRVTEPNPLAQRLLGAALLRQERFEEAIGHIREALKINPAYVSALSDMGTVLLESGRPEEAIRWYVEALEIQPDSAMAHQNLGKALFSLGRGEEAIEHLRKALLIEPESAKIRKNLGRVLVRTGHLDEGLAMLLEVTGIDPEKVGVHKQLALSYLGKGELDAAVLIYLAVLTVDPDDAEVHYNLARALTLQSKLDEAAAHFEEALRIDPGFAGAQEGLRDTEMGSHKRE